MPTRPVYVYTELIPAEVLRLKGEHLRRWAKLWWRRRTDELQAEAGSYKEYRRLLAKATHERAELRRSGKLIDSMSALVGSHLRHEMSARGWDHPWPKLAPGMGSVGGRRMGSPTVQWPATFLVTIDEQLVDQMQRATHKVSEEAVQYLAAGHQKVPDWMHPVVTTGDVMRAAVNRAIADWYPGPEHGVWDHLPHR
ncbi:hypothetical protein SAMN04488074_1366 [Lentzea albidocapillata subsp. violacea]|uniref:Uncharacterized protein n=1 Tax=Lentzea albidocapillata subsp. violacea TaxID=128104 RepID=A0A1G9YWQ9_9PSEU|nr:hypothetical protein [Lentzea albidocapillata]SDN13357.1 hypothetical protein SAMN04488074_1366 [Lentzea albidocapillata subsp. violacea]